MTNVAFDELDSPAVVTLTEAAPAPLPPLVFVIVVDEPADCRGRGVIDILGCCTTLPDDLFPDEFCN